jgi:hypothetical protein
MDRIRHMATRTPDPSDFVHKDAHAIPMPGRLPVSHYDWDLRLGFKDVPLADVPTGTLVTTSGTITSVVRLSGGRAMVVVTSDDRNSSHVLLNEDVVRMVAPALYRGNRLNVRGLVTRTTPSQPAGIDGRGVQVEIV